MLPFRPAAWIRPALTLIAAAGILTLTACGGGSGAPNNPYEPAPTLPGPLSVVPGEATAYPGTPLVLSISGGTPPYSAFSANPAALPVPPSVSGSTLTLLANPVDTPQGANVTIRDASGQTATAEIIVRPAALLPASITITPNGAPCGGGDVCSGQTAVATVKVQGAAGSPIAGRQVRFDVVQGQFSLATTNPGSPLASTQTVVSDANGEARVIISVPANTPTQIGLLRATELTTGSQVTAQFVIQQVTDGTGILSVIPNGNTTITGPAQNICSAGVRVTHYVFGGTPPYRVAVSFPDAVSLVNAPVLFSGGGFDVITNGTCFENLTFAITDATGRVLTTGIPTVTNAPGTQTPTPPPTSAALAVAPATTTVTGGCQGRTFEFVATGGTQPYSATIIVNPQSTPPTAPVIAQDAGGRFRVSFPATPAVTNATAILTISDTSTPVKTASTTITCNP